MSGSGPPPDPGNGAAHRPVLCEEVVSSLCVVRDGAYVDCTFGRGGHTRAMLAALDGSARLLAIDRDPDAIDAALVLAAHDPRVVVRRGRLSELAAIAGEAGFEEFLELKAIFGYEPPQKPAR